MEYLYEVAKNGTSIDKVKIAKECPRTYFLDTVVDKRVYKIEGNDELAGYNTYCWYFKDKEIAKKWLSSIKNRDFAYRCETKILPSGTQKTIDCLEDVRDSILDISNGWWKCFKDGNLYMTSTDLQGCLEEIIDQKISELKGE